jgi:AraC-like DNA-binding protein
MKIDDIIYTCEKIAGVFFIPVRLYDAESHLRSFGLDEFPVDPVLPYMNILLQKEKRISYCLTPFHQCYGAVLYGNFTIIAGPIGRSEYTTQEKRDYAFALGIDQSAFDRLYRKMLTITDFTVPHFLHILLLINFIFNREKLYYNDIAAFAQAPGGAADDFPPPPAHTSFEPTDEPRAPAHNMLSFERQMLSFIRAGDTAGLKRFFETNTHGTPAMMSENHLRHLKNFFVMSVTLVSRAAMDGGLSEEEALDLSNKYILQNEKLFAAEAVISLMNRMVMDYARRMSELEKTGLRSHLVSSVVSFIKQNISSALDGGTIARQFKISRKTLNSRFKAETGKTSGAFISAERIRRAESLLLYTDKSLVEIADYLGYASQSHFQTRFKAAKNQTPLEFRKSKQLER